MHTEMISERVRYIYPLISLSNNNTQHIFNHKIHHVCIAIAIAISSPFFNNNSLHNLVLEEFYYLYYSKILCIHMSSQSVTRSSSLKLTLHIWLWLLKLFFFSIQCPFFYSRTKESNQIQFLQHRKDWCFIIIFKKKLDSILAETLWTIKYIIIQFPANE